MVRKMNDKIWSPAESSFRMMLSLLNLLQGLGWKRITCLRSPIWCSRLSESWIQSWPEQMWIQVSPVLIISPHWLCNEFWISIMEEDSWGYRPEILFKGGIRGQPGQSIPILGPLNSQYQWKFSVYNQGENGDAKGNPEYPDTLHNPHHCPWCPHLSDLSDFKKSFIGFCSAWQNNARTVYLVEVEQKKCMYTSWETMFTLWP